MRVEVLGAFGGESPRHAPVTFLLDGHLAIDAGSLCRRLSLDDQLNIDAVVLTHAHMDHVQGLALFADQIIGRREAGVTVYCGPESSKTLRNHMFNNALWPNFTTLPRSGTPVLRIKTQRPARRFVVESGHEILFIPVDHPVETMGLIITGQDGSVAISGDTGPTTKLWEYCAKTPNLKAIFLDLSFPDRLRDLAISAGHMTPSLLVEELPKLPAGVDVFLYHFKPVHFAELRRELRNLRSPRLHLVADGDVFEV